MKDWMTPEPDDMKTAVEGIQISIPGSRLTGQKGG